MAALDELLKHQDKVSKTIEEFKKRDELLNDYTNKFSEITGAISDLESELIIWNKEKEDLQKNPANKEEVIIWEDQIKKIETNLKVKQSDLNALQKELDELNIENESLRTNLQITEAQHIEYLVNQFQKYHNFHGDGQNINKYREGLVSNLNLLKTLWKIQGKNYDLAAFVKFFKSNDMEVDLNILNDLFKELKSYIIPSIVSDFLDEYLNESKLNNIIESTCKIGSTIFQLKTDTECKLTVLLDDPSYEELINLLYTDKSIEFTNVDTIQEEPMNNYDVVLGFSDMIQDSQTVLNDMADVSANIQFFMTSLKLKEDGVGFCIVNPEVTLNWGDKSVFTNLEKYDLHIDSIIRLAAEIFPENDSNKTLLIIKRMKPKKVFIGELNNNSQYILLENLKNRKSGKIPQHGMLTDLESFNSFGNFLAKNESEYLATSTGLQPLKFKKIVKNVLEYNDISETGEDFNYFFLPLNYNHEAVLSSQNFKLKSENYLQILVDPEIALADYVARFYNTPLGKKIRESLSVGSVLPRISTKQLNESDIYLPDLDSQIELVRVDSLITELTTRAQSYKLKLWNSHLNLIDIQKEIEDMDEGKSEAKFEQWIESLPYPLASILWCSITNPQYERKVKYLLHFFEAFSEFNMSLLLSGLSSDEKFFEVEVKRRFRDDSRFRNWYFKPTFGNWYKFGSCLSKTVRRLLEENKIKCLDVFGNPDPDFLLRIAHKDLITISEEVANYRNQWEGHGPVVSEKEYQNRYKILRSVLSRVYQILSDAYENTFLILPLQSSFEDGVHNYTIKRYMSTRAPFKPDNIETVKLMDKSKIYLAHENQRKPVEMLPFMINIDKACYFYNGRDYETGKARYVSYHYHEKPEILVSMDKFNRVISLLKP
ncbi:hypothetical protein [Methanobacterium formicicum]|uniref:hypothetical protein n=1 Tax=Methanobacterium formicicum TaxID=2162 RepID=UPI00249215AE|nr:hypothetical protein [Methanobacterium formicicum]